MLFSHPRATWISHVADSAVDAVHISSRFRASCLPIRHFSTQICLSLPAVFAEKRAYRRCVAG